MKCCLPPTLWGDGYVSSTTPVKSGREPHQESWPSNVVESVNKENVLLTEMSVLFVKIQIA